MDIETERIDLGTFQKMWNGEIDAVHDQMVDALENKYVWKFVLDETYNGSAKVFEFFMECEMPSRYALIQLMNTVPDEWYELSEEELDKRIGFNQFEEFAIIYYVLLEKAKVPGFYKGDIGNMYYDGFWRIQPLLKNESDDNGKLIYENRTWLEDIFNDYIESDKRYLLLIGGPGYGKSQFLAHCIHNIEDIYAYYFLLIKHIMNLFFFVFIYQLYIKLSLEGELIPCESSNPIKISQDNNKLNNIIYLLEEKKGINYNTFSYISDISTGNFFLQNEDYYYDKRTICQIDKYGQIIFNRTISSTTSFYGGKNIIIDDTVVNNNDDSDDIDVINNDTNTIQSILNLDEVLFSRINNTFATATKNLLSQEKNNFELLKDFSFDQEIGSLVNTLLDSNIRACGKNNFIISYESNAIVEQNMFNIKMLNDVYNKVTNSNKTFAIVTNDKWEELKKEYINHLNNNIKYEIVDEPELLFEESDKNDIISSSAIDLFGEDIVEIE